MREGIDKRSGRTDVVGMTERRLPLLFFVAVAALFAVAFSAHAQTFPSSTAFLQSVVHQSNGAQTYASNVDISNLSPFDVDVDALYIPVNSPCSAMREYGNFIHLAPMQRLEMPDFLVSTLERSSGNGMVRFTAYRSGQARPPVTDGCGRRIPVTPRTLCPQDCVFPEPSISVTSHICVGVPVNVGVGMLGMPVIVQGTLCQSLRGVTDYDYASSADANGLDHVSITGIREGNGWRSRIYYANPSDHTSTWIVITLMDGHNVQRGERSFPVGPLENWSPLLGDLFPALTENRLDRAPIESPWVMVSQTTTALEPNKVCLEPDDQFGYPACPQLIPAYMAFVSVTDMRSGDSETHEASYDVPMGYVSPLPLVSALDAERASTVTAFGSLKRANAAAAVKAQAVAKKHKRLEKE